jgi:GH15 family glucan-1,4-alpha-glucosidase
VSASLPEPAPIEDHAIIGDKHTAALIARDGTVDWLCPQRFDAPSAFAALLDPHAGGFTLRPDAPFTTRRRYRPDTNVLETTFTTADGEVRVTDAMALPLGRPLDFTQLIRRVDGVSGKVAMRWGVAPRFDYGQRAGRVQRRAGMPVILHGDHVLTVECHGAGEPQLSVSEVTGAFLCEASSTAIIALGSFDIGPLAFDGPERLAERLEATVAHWERWSAAIPDMGEWTVACRRSVLALDLMVDAETGAIVAAPTLGLPERPGGDRNYDYRYAWLRDTSLTLEAMLRVGLTDQVHASLRWLFQAVADGRVPLPPLFGLDGGTVPPARQLDLEGRSGPVVVGNAARDQFQLDGYGQVFDMVWNYIAAGNALSDRAAQRLADLADDACARWRTPDAGLWELPDDAHYTQSKLACILALRRAQSLADLDAIPGEHAGRWAAAERDLCAFVHERCWSEARQAYVGVADEDGFDAAVLLSARGGLLADEPDRVSSTIDAIREHLGAGGPFLYRTSGLAGREGAFLACSFWLVEALARVGRLDEAEGLLRDLVGRANDLGLYAEEIDPSGGAFRGNFPQALTHLALINAADVCVRAQAGRPLDPVDGERGQQPGGGSSSASPSRMNSSTVRGGVRMR